MSIEEKGHSKPSVFSWPIKSNTLTTSSSSEEITNAPKSIKYTAFMIKLKENSISNYGKISVTLLITCLSQLLSGIEYFVSMEV